METSEKSELSHLDVDEKDKASTSSPLRGMFRALVAKGNVLFC